jgi:uncharacterized protein DUF397
VSELGTYTSWRKSSFSHPAENCVQVAVSHMDGTVGVRDSKEPAGPILEFPATVWHAFTQNLRATR